MPPTFRSQDPIPDGPYKATKLWNDVIETFREGMALGRHRYKLKASSECFPATDAVSWLHARLIENPNFGPSVSRQQAVQLMQKLHKAKVFEDVRGPKHNKIDFADNGRLFRFITSPVKPQHSTVGRTPLSVRTSLMNVAPPEDNGSSPVKKKKQPPVEKEEMKTRVQAEEDALTDCQVLPRNQLTEAELHSVYKSMTLNSLRKILKLHDVGEIFDTSVVSGCHIHHNLSFVNKNGIVTNVDKKDQLPHWVVSAMRCLAYWPDKIEEGFAAYPGFEKDVFKVVKDYFDNQLQPLIPHELYEAFANVMTLHQHGSTQGALRLCCLFLSPPQRRKLTLLLRFMQKMISNTKLVLDEHISTRDLVVTTFSHSILMPQNEAEYDDFLTQYQVSFMVDNYADLLRVPEDLRLQIEEQVAYLQRARIKYSHDATLQVNSKPSIVYCEQVTVQEYESQRMTASQQALHQLLENVIKDANMNHKDKRKRLKQFQKNYPAIYAKRFPTSESEKELFPEKPRIKPALMNQPLRFKLKSLRL
ncbi:hypothetical protein CAPTEDRAFT_172714 [Capitella teleta]|uniref:DEP domain-containing protein n=1 Tax=Capitella teleta TaxID=283909 RepID=R7V9N6_CAPTE|nr:hypothetical protein CAPTEDRAFT_172714 [Capitella teleta]|eukprot:ELU12460.1 hypothetical protein CAPTEDRAFT_172714 [Capitella teleta]